MPPVSLESVLRRDRFIVATSLVLVTALAWSYLAWLAHKMPTMAWPGVTAMGIAVPTVHPWSATDAAYMFAMWAVMMVGMMTPSAAPMILVHARVARQAAAAGTPLAATGWFASGYLASWTVFSAAATALEAVAEQAALMAPMMGVTSRRFGGIILIAAGLYQWTPAKDACLRHCRAPLSFIQSHGGFQKDATGAFGLGFRHGLYCIGCCWALMALLFVGGVMNMAWVAGLSILVLAEKVAPAARVLVRAAGVVFALWGAWLVVAG